MYTIIIQIPKVLSNNEQRILVNSNQLTLIEKGKNLCPVSSLLQISDAMLSNPLENRHIVKAEDNNQKIDPRNLNAWNRLIIHQVQGLFQKVKEKSSDSGEQSPRGNYLRK